MLTQTPVPMTMRDSFFADPFFKSSWENFDKVRDAMMTESREMMKRFDEEFDRMACRNRDLMLENKEKAAEKRVHFAEKAKAVHNNETKKTVSSSSSNSDNAMMVHGNDDESWLFPRRWMMPSLRSNLSTMDLFHDKDSEVIRVKEDKEKLEVSLDTSQYRPDELKVSVNNGMITVEGKHEEKSQDEKRRVCRQFVRSYNLPQGAQPQDVHSNLSSDGVLVITAAKNPRKSIDVNIKHN